MSEFKCPPLKIAEIGTPNPDNSNTGHHFIIPEYSNAKYGFAEVWFGDSHTCKTPEEALIVAKTMAAAPDLLSACYLAYAKLTSIGENNCDLTAKILSEAIKKATE